MPRLVAAAPVVAAAAASLLAAAPAAADLLRVPVDAARVVRLPAEADAIVVGNPLIADVSPHDARLLIVTGKTFGATNLIVLDQAGRAIFDADIEVTGGEPGRVTLHRGRSRESYHCAPSCEAVAVVGDDPEYFGEVIEGVQTTSRAADTAAADN